MGPRACLGYSCQSLLGVVVGVLPWDCTLVGQVGVVVEVQHHLALGEELAKGAYCLEEVVLVATVRLMLWVVVAAHLELAASMILGADCLVVVEVVQTTKREAVHPLLQKTWHCSVTPLCWTAREVVLDPLLMCNVRAGPRGLASVRVACACVQTAACPLVAEYLLIFPLGAVPPVYCN